MTEEHDNAQVVTSADAQTLINALPEAEAITEDHAADMETQSEAIIKDHAVDVETQSEVIDEAKVQLSDEAHLHCICGGSVSAGDHTSHSDVIYTAWNGTDGITYNNNTAYVYLTDNATINSNLVVDGTTLYLCLNGKTYASNGTNKIQVKNGGAILMGWGTININGNAKINNNTASRWGGAICLRRDSNQVTQIIMRGGEISGNKAMKEGGAVHAVDKDCIFYLYDGKITGNTSVDGGAIYLNQEPSTLSMHGGEISGNTATGNGGGIYIYRTGSVCELYGGKIENNKASGSGGGIYINPSNSGKLRVGNTAVVQSNTVSGKSNNVYLPSGKTLSIDIGMTPPYASIGITTANTSYPVAFSDAYGKNYAECFFADDVNAHVEYKDDQKLYLVSGVVARPLTVTFDPNGGTLDEADKTRSVNTGERYGTLPVPSYAGYDFAGWYTEKNGGTEIKEDTTVTVAGTQTLYAHWTPIHVHAYT